MANVDFDSLQKEFSGALPSGFEGVKNLALQTSPDFRTLGVGRYALVTLLRLAHDHSRFEFYCHASS